MLIPRILPHNILIAVLLIAVSGARFKKIRPRDIVKENSTPRITSVFSLAFSARGPRIKAIKVEKIKAIRNGLKDKTRPKAEPAKAA